MHEKHVAALRARAAALGGTKRAREDGDGEADGEALDRGEGSGGGGGLSRSVLARERKSRARRRRRRSLERVRLAASSDVGGMPAASLRRVRRRGEEAVRGQVRAPGCYSCWLELLKSGEGWRGGNVSELPQARAQAAADEDVLHVKREVGEPGRDAGARGGGGEGASGGGGLSGWKSCESGRTDLDEPSPGHARHVCGVRIGDEKQAGKPGASPVPKIIFPD